MRQLSDWLDSYLEYTSNTEPPSIFRVWCGVSVIASCLMRKCYLSWGRETFYPNFYIILVGPPASRKGTAMKPAKALLDKMGVCLSANETSRQRLIQVMKSSDGAARSDVDRSTGESFWHSSMTIFSSELTVFLSRKDEKGLIPTLCQWFDCEDKFVYATVQRQEEEISNVWVNMLGATTPTLLQSSLPIEAVGAGLISRTIFVYAAKKGKVVYIPTLTEKEIELEKRLITDLEHILHMAGQFKLDADGEFIENYIAWRDHHERHQAVNLPVLLTYLDRRPLHILKLSMIMSVSRSNEMVLRSVDLQRANDLLERTESVMESAFQGVGESNLAGVQARIMATVASRGQISSSELMGMYISDITQSDLVDILGTLHYSGFIVWDAKTRMVKYNR